MTTETQTQQQDKPEMFDEQVQALAKHLDLDNEDLRMIEESNDYYSFGGRDYLVLTDDEADEKAKEYILDTAWAFNSSFLSCHSKGDVDEEVFKVLSEKCESSNDAVLSLIDDKDDFVNDAISSDGRGHFLSQYDGNENEEEINGTTYYIYKCQGVNNVILFDFIGVNYINMEKQTEFKKLVDTLFKTKIEASQKLGVSRQTINNWYIGKHKVPVVIINYLKQLN